MLLASSLPLHRGLTWCRFPPQSWPRWMHRLAAKLDVQSIGWEESAGDVITNPALFSLIRKFSTPFGARYRAGLYERSNAAIIGRSIFFLRFEQKRSQILKRDPVEVEGSLPRA